MAINPIFLVLAAGQAKRFGSAKLGARLPNGMTIIENTLTAIKSTDKTVCMVASENSGDAIAAAKQLAIPVCQYPGQSPGLGDSIRCGVQHNEDSDGWIICLADMPYIPTSIYQQIFRLAQSHLLVAPACQGRQGHPIFFHSSYRRELLEQAGDTGTKSLLRRHAESLFVWECNDRRVLQDIDVPADIHTTNRLHH